MIKTKVNNLFIFGLAVVASLFLMAILSGQQAFAATKTWTGEGADNNWSTAENWSPSGAPVNADDLVFSGETEFDYDNPTVNDIDNLSINSINLIGESCDWSSIWVTGGTLTLGGNLTDDSTESCEVALHLLLDVVISADVNIAARVMFGRYDLESSLEIGANSISISGASISFTSTLSGSGDIGVDGDLRLYDSDNSGYTGTITVTSGSIGLNDHSNILGSGNVIISDGATLYISPYNNLTVTTPITLTGNGHAGNAKLSGSSGPMGRCPDNQSTVTLANLTIENSVQFDSWCDLKLVINNPNLNGHSISMATGSAGELIIDGTEQTAERKITVINEDSNETRHISVRDNNTYVINAKLPNTLISVGSGGILKGTGLVGTVNVNQGGVIAPGLSPGILTVGNILFLEGGIYEFEAEGTDEGEYDRIVSEGSVTLGDGTLEVILLEGFSGAAGDEMMIIQNNGGDPVDGTFADLPEGATFSQDGYVFEISYEGGSGNDVVLTLKSVPDAPDTGFGLLHMSPVITTIIGAVSAATIAIIARKFNSVYQLQK